MRTAASSWGLNESMRQLVRRVTQSREAAAAVGVASRGCRRSAAADACSAESQVGHAVHDANHSLWTGIAHRVSFGFACGFGR